jgi:hypothetical protein
MQRVAEMEIDKENENISEKQPNKPKERLNPTADRKPLTASLSHNLPRFNILKIHKHDLNAIFVSHILMSLCEARVRYQTSNMLFMT